MSDYTGRLGTICDRIRARFNDVQAGFVPSDATILTLVNECKDDLVISHYYRKRATLNVTAGATIDLATQATDFYEIQDHGLFWAETGQEIFKIPQNEVYEYAAVRDNVDVPPAYRIDGTTMTLMPLPSTTTSAGLVMHYFYRPADITGAAGSVTPPVVPQALDIVFVAYGLWRLHESDRHAPTAPQFAIQYQAEYERWKAKLLGNSRGTVKVRPYR